MANSNQAKIKAIRSNFGEPGSDPPTYYKRVLRSEASPVLDQHFGYKRKVFTEYIVDFLRSELGRNTFNELKLDTVETLLEDKEDVAIRQLCWDTLNNNRAATKAALLKFHKFVLPLYADDELVKGLPFYFSPRLLKSGAIEAAKFTHPLSEVLTWPELRPKAETCTDLRDAFERRTPVLQYHVPYYASVKLDGYAAVWTGRGLITKEGGAKVMIVPPTMQAQLETHFGDEILLGELVYVWNEKEYGIRVRAKQQDKSLGKPMLSRLLTLHQDAVSTKAAGAIKAAKHTMFMVYDIISYKHRPKPYEKRLEILMDMFKRAGPLTRVRLIDQYRLEPFGDKSDPKGWTFWKQLPGNFASNIDEFAAKLPRTGDGLSSEAEAIVNCMTLGCITANQEGLILTPNLPYYDLHGGKGMFVGDRDAPRKPTCRIKIKPRLRFGVYTPSLNERRWYESKETLQGVVRIRPYMLLKDSDDNKELREALRPKRIYRTFNVRGQPPETTAAFRSAAFTYKFQGLRLEVGVEPSRLPRTIDALVPDGIGYFAEKFYKSLESAGVIASRTEILNEIELLKQNDIPDEFDNQAMIEAMMLMQIGNNLRLYGAGDYLTVVTDTLWNALNDEPAASVSVPSSAEERDNESIFSALFGLPVGELGYNRLAPSLRRFVEGSENIFARECPGMTVQTPLFVGIGTISAGYKNWQLLPKGVKVYTRYGDTSVMFVEVSPTDRVRGELYVNVRQTDPDEAPVGRPVRTVDNVVPYADTTRRKIHRNVKLAIDETGGNVLYRANNSAQQANQTYLLRNVDSAAFKDAAEVDVKKRGFATFDDSSRVPTNGTSIYYFLMLKTIAKLALTGNLNKVKLKEGN